MSTLATELRDAVFVRLTKPTVAIAKNWVSTRKVPIPTLQNDQLPSLGVFLIRESMDPDGDANTGPPKFISTATIGISVFVDATKPEYLEGKVDSLVDQIEDTLFTDSTFVVLNTPDTPTGVPFLEEISQVTRVYNFVQQGESYILECRLQITMKFRCFFAPLTPNDLLEVAVTVPPFQDTVQPGEYTEVIDLPAA